MQKMCTIIQDGCSEFRKLGQARVHEPTKINHGRKLRIRKFQLRKDVWVMRLDLNMHSCTL